MSFNYLKDYDVNLNFAVAIDHAQSWINELIVKEFSKIAVAKMYLDSSGSTTEPSTPSSGSTVSSTIGSSS